jgi:hypothetical protein
VSIPGLEVFADRQDEIFLRRKWCSVAGLMPTVQI